MRHVEARIRFTVAKKDEAIQALRSELQTALAQLRSTEAVLAAQEAALCD
jgi:hypothetical protein